MITTKKMTNSNVENNDCVIEILNSDNLSLANAKCSKPYGKAELKPFVKILLWTMRVYVLLSFILIVTQIFISLKK